MVVDLFGLFWVYFFGLKQVEQQQLMFDVPFCGKDGQWTYESMQAHFTSKVLYHFLISCDLSFAVFRIMEKAGLQSDPLWIELIGPAAFTQFR